MKKIKVLHSVVETHKTGSKVLPWQSVCVYFVADKNGNFTSEGRYTAKSHSTTKSGAIADAIDFAYRQAIKKAVL